MFVGAESGFAGENRSLPVPAGVSHSFRNSGDKPLRARATLASPAFEAVYESAEEVSRGWEAGYCREMFRLFGWLRFERCFRTLTTKDPTR